LNKDLVIRICSHDIDVEFCDPGLWSDSGLGRASLLKAKIQVNNALSTDVMMSTLLHECMHLVSDIGDLELSEAQVSGVANGVFSIIKDNPDLVKELVTLVQTTKEINNGM